MSDGHVVIVANGRDGYARRDASGRWERIAFGAGGSVITWGDPHDQPPPLTGGLWVLAGELAAAFLTGIFTLSLGAWRARGASRWNFTGFGSVILLGAPFALLGTLGLNHVDEFFPLNLLILMMFLAGSVMMLIGALGFAAGTVRATTGRRWLGPVLLVTAGTAAGCAAPFVAWSAGICDYRTAALVACLVAVLGTVLAVRAAPAPPS